VVLVIVFLTISLLCDSSPLGVGDGRGGRLFVARAEDAVEGSGEVEVAADVLDEPVDA
jgi:hypothetical protein